MKRFDGKIAVVAGAASGQGAAEAQLSSYRTGSQFTVDGGHVGGPYRDQLA